MNTSRLSAQRLIRDFSLIPHPEGGYYIETYRSGDRVTRHPGNVERAASTAIYYLLNDSAYSAWHRIASDEMWHFYAGSALDIHIMQPGSDLISRRLGNALEEPRAAYQLVVPAGCWFAAELVEPDHYAFVGCTVAPGFEFSEFELACPEVLIDRYPAHRALIERMAPKSRLSPNS